MITSPHNEKLKLIRRLGRRRSREREGLFVTEGEDLLAAARDAGAEPVELLTAAGEGLGGTEVEPALLAAGLEARLRHAGDRRLAGGLGRRAGGALRLPARASPTRATSGRWSAPPTRWSAAPSSSVPTAPIRSGRTRSGRAWEPSSREPLVRGGIEATPEPRAALVAHGGEPLDALDGAATLCLGAEREGLPDEVLEQCDVQGDDPACVRAPSH